MRDVLKVLYESVAFYEFKSTNFLLNIDDESICRVVCKPEMTELRDACAAYINAKGKQAPVIVFGFDAHMGLLEGEPDHVVQVRDSEALKKLHGFSY